MLACVDAGNVKKAETPTSPIPTAPETAANIFVKRVMCASLSTGRVPSGVIGTRSQPAEQRCALVHAHSIRMSNGPLRAHRSAPDADPCPLSLVLSAANVGADKDSERRQREAVEGFARRAGYGRMTVQSRLARHSWGGWCRRDKSGLSPPAAA